MKKLIESLHVIQEECKEHKALNKLDDAKAYYNGYVQACEDYGRKIRQMIFENSD